MQSNKGTQFKRGSGGACRRAAMSRRIVKGSVLPGAPEHAHPGSGGDADGMRVVAAAAFGALIDVGGPGRAMPGVVGKAGDGGAQAVIAGPAEDDTAAFAGLVGDWADAMGADEESTRTALIELDASTPRPGHGGSRLTPRLSRNDLRFSSSANPRLAFG